MREGRDLDEIEEGDSHRLYSLEELLSEVEVDEDDVSERSLSEDDRDNLLREIHNELISEDERDELVRDIPVVSKRSDDTENCSRRLTVRNLDPEEVYRLYYEEKLSQRKVAEVLGTSRDTIRQLFRTQGWDPRPVGGVEKDIDHQEVYRICVEEGRSKKEAAEILGCKSTKPITRVLKEHNWKTPLEAKMETEIDTDEVHRLHFEQGWSLIRIANHYGYESKDRISRLFEEREWTPIPIARRIVYEFPSEIEEAHWIESSRISDTFEHLGDLEIISPLDIARCIENLVSLSPAETRVEWAELPSQSNWHTKVIEVLEGELEKVETSLNEILGISEDSKMRVRVGFVDGKLYIRYQDKSEYSWMNIYENELFYFNSVSDKFKLVHEMRARLGLSTNTDLGKLIDQLTDRESAEGNGYSDIRECQDNHLRAETLHLILDITGVSLQEIRESIECVGRTREEAGGIRNPQFPDDPETIDIMFAKFFGLGLSDGHLSSTYSQFVYAERNPDRRKIVIEHSKDFGDVHYSDKEVEGETRQIQFASVFGRALRRKGFPAGDKCILNTGLPEFIMNGSFQTICVYFRNLWPEDGSFTSTGPNNRGEFKWNRSVALRDPIKESEYNHDSRVTGVHLAFFEEHGTYVEEDGNGFREKIVLPATTLEELTKSESHRISSIAKEIKNIVYSNQPKLLLDEIEALRKTGVYATPRHIEINYYIDTSRVSAAWSGRIYRKTAVMKTALQMLPDDFRKRARVEEWMILYPALKRRTEREIKSKHECE